MAKANIHVAYIVIHPLLPIKPGIVKVKTKLKRDSALTMLANSITLTPGGRFEKMLEVIFALSPSILRRM